MSLVSIICLVGSIFSIVTGFMGIYEIKYFNLGKIMGKEVQYNYSKKDGIISKSKLGWKLKSKKNRKETFVAEILNESITLDFSKDNKCIDITLNRKNVDNVIITTKGKNSLLESFFSPEGITQQDRIERLLNIDNKVQKFLITPSGQESIEENTTTPIPFRWASGGVLSIVKWKERDWVPVFFRDIPSVGWNIALGASERHFKNGLFFARADNDSLEKELYKPKEVITREFLEETLIITCEGNLNTDPWIIHPILIEGKNPDIYAGFINRHKELRGRYDITGYNNNNNKHFAEGDTINVTPIHFNKNAVRNNLLIHSPRYSDPTKSDPDIILFNILDLGIEYIKIVRYNFPDKGIFLDGEVLNDTTLVRMPVAFLSLDYIKKTFNETSIHWGKSNQFPRLSIHEAFQNSRVWDRAPSVLVENTPKHSTNIKETDIYFFMHDIEQRRRIRKQRDIVINEERDQIWFKHFDKHFPESKDAVCSPSDLFTYATCRSFQQLVHMIEKKVILL